ncbi:hypothetical protein quinque_014226 [Culex quinquefasciatus]
MKIFKGLKFPGSDGPKPILLQVTRRGWHWRWRNHTRVVCDHRHLGHTWKVGREKDTHLVNTWAFWLKIRCNLHESTPGIRASCGNHAEIPGAWNNACRSCTSALQPRNNDSDREVAMKRNRTFSTPKPVTVIHISAAKHRFDSEVGLEKETHRFHSPAGEGHPHLGRRPIDSRDLVRSSRDKAGCSNLQRSSNLNIPWPR